MNQNENQNWPWACLIMINFLTVFLLAMMLGMVSGCSEVTSPNSIESKESKPEFTPNQLLTKFDASNDDLLFTARDLENSLSKNQFNWHIKTAEDGKDIWLLYYKFIEDKDNIDNLSELAYKLKTNMWESGVVLAANNANDVKPEDKLNPKLKRVLKERTSIQDKMWDSLGLSGWIYPEKVWQDKLEELKEAQLRKKKVWQDKLEKGNKSLKLKEKK